MTFSSGLLFLRHIGLFPNFAFRVVLGETLLPKCAYRHWDHFRFLVKKVKIHSKSQVKLWFLGISLISVFTLYVNNLSLITFNTPPPSPQGHAPPRPRGRPQAPRRRRWPSRCGRPRPLGGRPRAPRRRRRWPSRCGRPRPLGGRPH